MAIHIARLFLNKKSLESSFQEFIEICSFVVVSIWCQNFIFASAHLFHCLLRCGNFLLSAYLIFILFNFWAIIILFDIGSFIAIHIARSFLRKMQPYIVFSKKHNDMQFSSSFDGISYYKFCFSQLVSWIAWI